MSSRISSPLGGVAVVVVMLCGALVGAACSSTSTAMSATGTVTAVGAENEYADVISAIGGRYVSVTAVMSNPNTDPHTFESSPQVAHEISAAQLVVQNGLGYDSFMNSIEAASPNPARKVIDVRDLLGLSASTPNPHLWYNPTTMPVVAKQLVSDLSALRPSHAAYFKGNEEKFAASMQPWLQAVAKFKAQNPRTPVAVTEPVGDYMLQAVGANVMTPFAFQADIMNGVDPSPQAVSLEQNLFTSHLVKVFLYNRQVTDSLTRSLLTLADRNGIPVVGLYETMPTPGYGYQSWMLAEVDALEAAVVEHTSTQEL